MASSCSIEPVVPKPRSRHSANSWISKADEDIEAAELCLTVGERMANVAAFHAQQAAEKLLKALISAAGIERRVCMIWQYSLTLRRKQGRMCRRWLRKSRALHRGQC